MSQVKRVPLGPRAVLALGCVAAAGALSSVPAGASVFAPPPVPGADPLHRADQPGDHLTVTVRHAGPGADGTYDVRCDPPRGSHPQPARACAVVERNTRWGKDTFAPVPEGSVCTMRYGGPATAHVTGTWAGRPVDAVYDRSNGCEIARWDRLVPLLPGGGDAARPEA